MSNPLNIFCFIALLVLVSCNKPLPKPEDKQLGERIMAVVKSTGAEQLSMDTIVKEPWDHLYILHPYTSDDQIASLKKEIKGLSAVSLTGAMYSDRSSHLIFTLEGNIVTHMKISRYPCCDFIASGIGATSLAKKEAVFKIERSFVGKDSVYTLSVAK